MESQTGVEAVGVASAGVVGIFSWVPDSTPLQPTTTRDAKCERKLTSGRRHVQVAGCCFGCVVVWSLLCLVSSRAFSPLLLYVQMPHRRQHVMSSHKDAPTSMSWLSFATLA